MANKGFWFVASDRSIRGLPRTGTGQDRARVNRGIVEPRINPGRGMKEVRVSRRPRASAPDLASGERGVEQLRSRRECGD